ncbi:MAG: radical SAM protein, partial [Chitinophagales bacterium]
MQEVLKKINRRIYPKKLFYSPTWMILVVNNVCNLHCKMCDVGVGFEESNFYVNMLGAHPINMPVELVKRIVDQTAASFRDTKIAFSFTEPIIYPHLVESVAYATEHRLHAQMTTNGSKLAALSEDLVKAGIKEICVSLDGPPEIHNFIRGNKHSFEWAFAGLEKISSINKNIPELTVACAIT